MLKRTNFHADPPNASCLALVAHMFDAIDHCLAIYDESGVMRYANRAMADHLAVATDEENLRSELALIAARVRSSRTQMRSNSGIQRACQDAVETANGNYTVEGIHIAAGLIGDEPAVLISMRLPPPDPFCSMILRQRYGLTKKQVGVARLVVQGLRNEEIAQRLCISEHTARHHVEQIKLKVGAHTRAAVAARILGGVLPCEKL
jgi:DNA-binding CsgD family transcriptional regulator